MLETSLKVILGSGPTAIPLPKSNCPDQHAQWGVEGSPLPSQGGLRHILSAPIPPSCLPSWCPLSFHEHPCLASIITHSPRHVPELLWIGRACYHLAFLGKTFFFPSFSASFTCHHLQRPAGRTYSAKPAWLSLDTHSSVTKQLPRRDSHRERLPREAEMPSLPRASETPGGWN